ncbi:MAG: glycerophosphodiester phosphodiesterase family protein [Flavobacteriaceae bacterium]
MKKIIAIILILSILTSCNKMINSTKTMVIAHRGFSEIAPENTLIAFQKAIETGVPYFELDVHQSKDGKLMVIHDYSVNRTSSNGKTGKVNELLLSELNDVKVGYSKKFKGIYTSEKIPTLKEALLLAKGKIKVCVEIKAKNIGDKVVKLIEELDMVNQVIVFSFHFETVKKVKALNPKIETLFLKDNATIKTIDKALSVNLDAIGVWHKETKFSKELMDYAHKNSIKVFTYTVNDPKRMKELINLKLDGIITNRPDVALKILN